MSGSRLLAVSDLHVSYEENRAVVEGIRPTDDGDWLLVAGDIGERSADIEWTLRLLADRFAQVVWVPGNHELWTHDSDPLGLRGEPRYRHLVDLCRSLGVLTPEDPYTPTSRGRGYGSTSEPAPEAFDLVVGLARHGGRGRRPADLALLLFAERLPVPEATVRAAFRAAVDRVVLSVEKPEEDNDPAEDPEERAARIADRAVAAELTMTLVPARARRIDARIARHLHGMGLSWPPPELAAWTTTPAPHHSPLTTPPPPQ
ncbi:metallophosphoesterase [Actinacidiphila oryziradicis]|uniref:metallophosphoesterase n=1 Tax=Actinacidiphila oryziradicis TaxID=2571141 RepID=UPI001FE960FB|nr:metallophosphoesterase [Actinacidiphila oryziradicis]